MEEKYYVYIWKREDNDSTFYVGKGCGRRAANLIDRNEHFKRIVNKVPCHYEILKENMTENDAYELEKQTIQYYINLGYGIDIEGYPRTKEFYLVNSTLGGDGTNGYKYKEGAKAGKNNSFYGKHHTDETKEILRQAKLGTKASDETKKKLSEMRKGKGNVMYGKRGELSPLYGRKHSEESNLKKSESLGTPIRCIELNKTFPSMSSAKKYIKENFNVKLNHSTLTTTCNGTSRKDWYGQIELNGVPTKLHWTFVEKEIDTYND